MSATLYLAPTLHVALDHTVASVRSLRLMDSLAPVQLLLPRSETIAQYEDRLGTCAAVRLVQFHSLAEAILRPARRYVRRLHTDEQLHIVGEVLAELSGRGVLTTYANVVDKPGFASALLDWLREAKGQGVTPAHLAREARRSGTERDRQLAAFYALYERALGRRRADDGDGLLWRAERLLRHPGAPYAPPRLLIVAAFDQFSPAQLELLVHLRRRVEDFAVYLLWQSDQPPDGLAIARLGQTRAALCRRMDLDVVELPEAPSLAPVSEPLRRGLFRTDAEVRYRDDPRVRAVEAPSREAEVRLALRAVKQLLLDGVAPATVAVLAPHQAQYERAVRAVAFEYGIPVDSETPIVESPAVAALLKVLDLHPDFPRRETLDVLRSPYCEQPWLCSDQVAVLDRLTRERPVVRGLEQWRNALHRPEGRPDGQDAADDDRAGAPLLWSLSPDEALAIRGSLEAFLANLTPPTVATRAAHTLWLQEHVLGFAADDGSEPTDESPSVGMHLAERCGDGTTAWRDLAALGRVTGALRRLARDGPGVEVPWEQYRAELQVCLAGLSEPRPHGGAVRFDRLELGRHLALSHLFVLGLSEGEFPGPPPTDCFYSAEDRRDSRLPLVRRDEADAAGLWWQVLASPSDSLTLLRPRFDDGGAPWPPSPYWEAAIACVPGLSGRVERPPVAMALSVASAACTTELAVALAEASADTAPAPIAGAWQAAHAGHGLLRRRRSWDVPGVFEGVLSDPECRAEISAQFAHGRVWSLSRLSRYAVCPFSFYAETVLGLEAQVEPEPGMDPRVRGSLLHAVLESLFRRLTYAHLAPSLSAWPEISEHLATACEAVFARAPARFGFLPSALWSHEQTELRRMLEALVLDDCRGNGDPPRFRPYLQELRFGMGGTAPVTFGDGDGGEVRLHGVIDRIDRDGDGNLRLIDYKSGGKEYGEREILAGRALQTALYPLAADGFGDGGVVTESYYWHISTRKTSGRISAADGVACHPLAQQAREVAGRLIRSVGEGRFPIATDGSGCDMCDFAPLCSHDRQAHLKSRNVPVL